MEVFRAAQGHGTDWHRACRACIQGLADLPATANLGFVYASDPLAEALDLIVARLAEATGVRDWVGTGGAGVCGSGREYVGERRDRGSGRQACPSQLPAVRRPARRSGRRRPAGSPAGAQRRPAASAWSTAIRARAAPPRPIARLSETMDAFLVGGLTSAQRLAPADRRPADRGRGLGRPDDRRGAADHGPVAGLHADRPGPRGQRQPGALGAGDRRPAGGRGAGGRRSARSWRASRSGSAATSTPRCRCPAPIAPTTWSGRCSRSTPGAGRSRSAPTCAAATRCSSSSATAPPPRPTCAGCSTTSAPAPDGRPIRGALYHTCVARGANMFGPDSAELKMIEAALGPVPLAGFFTNGEIYHDRLYGYTGVLTLFL